jgi:hypothetical protein
MVMMILVQLLTCFSDKSTVNTCSKLSNAFPLLHMFSLQNVIAVAYLPDTVEMDGGMIENMTFSYFGHERNRVRS